MVARRRARGSPMCSVSASRHWSTPSGDT